MKVLLVDDCETTRECLSHFLAMEHLEVVVVRDGLEAIEQIGQHLQTFDLVISDVEMPRLDGWKLLAWVQEHEAALPVVLMSGMSPAIFLRLARERGARGALTKPFDLRKLRQLFETLFDFAGRPGSTEFYCPQPLLN